MYKEAKITEEQTWNVWLWDCHTILFKLYVYAIISLFHVLVNFKWFDLISLMLVVGHLGISITRLKTVALWGSQQLSNRERERWATEMSIFADDLG